MEKVYCIPIIPANPTVNGRFVIDRLVSHREAAGGTWGPETATVPLLGGTAGGLQSANVTFPPVWLVICAALRLFLLFMSRYVRDLSLTFMLMSALQL